MKIIFYDSFLERLDRQIRYISHDSKTNAKRFRAELLATIKKVKIHPYSNRRSIYFDDDNIRDLIFKGYTVVYRITEKNIEVFGLSKYQKQATDNN